MDELNTRMREVLLQLALTSNGKTATFNSSGGTSEPDYTPSLGFGDAPHLFYARAWNQAETDERRAQLLEEATDALRHLQHSSGDRTRVESEAELFARIVEHGEGIEAHEAAMRFRCGITLVRKARAGAGRDTDYGRRPRGDQLDADARRAEVARLAAENMSARQIAHVLDVSYNTVRRDLGRM